MKNELSNIEKLLKERLENYEPPCEPEWNSFEKKLNQGKSSAIKSLLSKIAIVTLLVSTALLFIYYFTQNSGEPSGYLSEKFHLLTNRQNSEQDVKFFKHDNNEVKENQNESPDKEINASPEETPENLHSYMADVSSSASSTTGSSIKLTEEDLAKTNASEKDAKEASKDKQLRTLPPKAAFDISNGILCGSQSIKLKSVNADVPKQYEWDFGDGYFSSDANPEHIYAQSGIYEIRLKVISLIDGQTSTASKTATVCASPEASFEWDRIAPVVINRNISFIDRSQDAIQWAWSFDDGKISDEQNPQHTFDNEDEYSVMLIVSNQYGCSDTAVEIISVKKIIDAKIPYVPSAFKPDGDGLNDQFCPVFRDYNDIEFIMTIYDRMGIAIFETTDITHCWNGKTKNNNGYPAPQGAYMWVIVVKDKYGDEQKYAGSVSLIK